MSLKNTTKYFVTLLTICASSVTPIMAEQLPSTSPVNVSYQSGQENAWTTQPSIVTFASQASTIPLVSADALAQIVVSEDDWKGVHRAATDFVNDVALVTNRTLSL